VRGNNIVAMIIISALAVGPSWSIGQLENEWNKKKKLLASGGRGPRASGSLQKMGKRGEERTREESSEECQAADFWQSIAKHNSYTRELAAVVYTE